MSKTKNYKTFAVIHNGYANVHTNFKLLPNSYIQVNDNEPTPIEDYGNWLISEEVLNAEQAMDKFLELI